MTTAASIPNRIRWAVDQLGINANDRILEIGCGRGAAASLICPRLSGGSYLGIDRSATAVEASTACNRQHIERHRPIRSCRAAGSQSVGTAEVPQGLRQQRERFLDPCRPTRTGPHMPVPHRRWWIAPVLRRSRAGEDSSTGPAARQAPGPSGLYPQLSHGQAGRLECDRAQLYLLLKHYRGARSRTVACPRWTAVPVPARMYSIRRHPEASRGVVSTMTVDQGAWATRQQNCGITMLQSGPAAACTFLSS